MLSDKEREWIYDRIHTLTESIIKESDDPRAAEIRELQKTLDEEKP